MMFAETQFSVNAVISARKLKLRYFDETLAFPQSEPVKNRQHPAMSRVM
jgi:hypothetical protein